MDDEVDSDKAFDFCNAFEAWGRLSTVPAILQSYDRYFESDEAELLPFTLSLLLEPERGPLSETPSRDEFIGYHQRVMDRYEALLEQFGSDQVVLLQGERFSVVSLARKMLRNLGSTPEEKTLQPFYRHRFEASTGLDCSCFYKNEEFQPLTTAAFLERFLESPEAARYEEGVRYFFGHRIPE
ncbi:hypothetical protein [Archangium sp.]|uniref:hypothetical protein n=1 Tax=Archangium sp. TaxID=1872627 RepID=UPI002D26DA88|nr:hypothetical protein [Archangium sp.]HYO56873.1 hypothetical protein [Archangium sp.]